MIENTLLTAEEIADYRRHLEETIQVSEWELSVLATLEALMAERRENKHKIIQDAGITWEPIQHACGATYRVGDNYCGGCGEAVRHSCVCCHQRLPERVTNASGQIQS